MWNNKKQQKIVFHYVKLTTYDTTSINLQYFILRCCVQVQFILKLDTSEVQKRYSS